MLILQIAENVKEFFHHEGIHSTTIQPEFVEVNGQGNRYGSNGLNQGSISEDDCVLGMATLNFYRIAL